MARVTKDAEERREEIVDVAARKFLGRGYDHTSIHDIVQEIGVAQGTFYYHFRSKADVLDAVVDRLTAGLAEQVASIVEDERQDEVERLRAVVHRLLDAISSSQRLIEYLRRPGNEVLHGRMADVLRARLAPPLERLVETGKRSGRFDVPFSRETVELLLSALTYLTRTVSADDSRARVERLHTTVFFAIHRILGIEDPRSTGTRGTAVDSDGESVEADRGSVETD